jgi:uncharacterized protein with GYD domain
MPKVMVIASYTAEGAKGLLKDGGSARRKALKSVASNVGGKLESFYFGFGSDDVYVTLDVPDNATAAAISLVVGATGAVRSRTVVLMTPEEIDEAAEKSKATKYRAPGA